MNHLAFDVRDAFRALRGDGGYSITVVLTLALTIGATTAVFSIVNSVLLKPLAYRESHRLVELREVWRQLTRLPSLEVNEQHFEYWRQHAQSFESMAQYIPLPANLTGAGDAAQIIAVHTSSSIFDVLGVQPAIGRTLAPDDERAGRPEVTVITDAFWRQRLGADRSIVGRSIALDGTLYTVIGVLPSSFQLPDGSRLTSKVDAFIPIRVDDDHVGWVGDHNNAAIARLRAGVTPDQARAELDALQAQVSVRAANDAHEPVTLSSLVAPLTESIVGNARRGLLLLLAAIMAVLIIGCSNLANLSLTRTTGRFREIAIRSALGAARSRLIAHALVEQLLLAGVGGAVAVWVASAALAAFVKTAPVDLPRAGEVALDARVLVFTAAVSIAAGLLVAVVPAWRIARGDVQAPLRTGSGTLTADRSGARTRAILLALQVAMSVTLLVVTALLSASFLRLLHVDKGFTPDRVLALGVALPADRYAAEPVRLAAYDRLIAGVQAVPGITVVTTASMLPMGGEGQVNFIAADGDVQPRSEQPSANFRFIAPGFFRTLGIRIVRGRAFTERERARDQPAPAVVSESTAERLWPGEDAIGKTFSRGQQGEQGFQVVGIATNARTTSLVSPPPLMVYVPYWWNSRAASRTATSLLIKTAIDPAALVSTVRRVVRGIDPDIAIGDARPLTEIVDASLASRRYQTRLFVTFGLVALAIAIVGVYCVTTHGVSRRRREMNIRVALGAGAAHVLGLVVRQAAMPVVAGLAMGIVGSIALGSVVANLLFEVPARDPRIIGLVAAIVGSVGIATAFAAARQGLTIDPAAALREE
jgi:macrolide transport system ATP-binding/permease protein